MALSTISWGLCTALLLIFLSLRKLSLKRKDAWPLKTGSQPNLWRRNNYLSFRISENSVHSPWPCRWSCGGAAQHGGSVWWNHTAQFIAARTRKARGWREREKEHFYKNHFSQPFWSEFIEVLIPSEITVLMISLPTKVLLLNTGWIGNLIFSTWTLECT